MKLSNLFLASLALLPALSLGGAPPTPEQAYNDAGYIDVGEDGGHHLFYWMFESRNEPETDPVILWLSGGPGCSSSLALFFENGPLQVEDNLTLTVNPYSWTSNATVVWVDQPVGTGFSYGGHLHNEDQVGSDMAEFIIAFFQRYPQYQGLDFYVYGESYAGHYVPVVSSALVSALKQTTADVNIPFKGLAIGNGLTDPPEQYKYYLPFAEEHDLVNEPTEKIMSAVLKACEPLIEACNYNGTSAGDDDFELRIGEWSACVSAYALCNMGEITPVEMTGINPYDVRVECGSDSLCYDFTPIDEYLNQEDVKEALGVTKPWRECSTLVDLVMVYGGDWMKSFSYKVANLLEDGYTVLIYAGEYDYMCNWLGNRAWTQALEWTGSQAFAAASNTTWTTQDGVAAGTYFSAEGLTFLKVNNAGHMAPHDQPQNTLDMVRKHTVQGFWN